MKYFKLLVKILLAACFSLILSCSHNTKRKGPSIKADKDFMDLAKERCSHGDKRSCHLSGLIMASLDFDSSMENFRRGCSLGDGRSCFNLGILEREAGHSLKGMKLIRRSCQVHQDSFACFKLGSLLGASGAEGRGFLKKSCGLDYSAACYSIGEHFQKEKKTKKAESFFNKGCELNHFLSCRALEAIYKKNGQLDKANEMNEKIKNL